MDEGDWKLSLKAGDIVEAVSGKHYRLVCECIDGWMGLAVWPVLGNLTGKVSFSRMVCLVEEAVPAPVLENAVDVDETSEVELRFKKLATTQVAPRTQKALGVWRLTKHSPFALLQQPTDVYLGLYTRNPTEGIARVPLAHLRKFARPCPKRPRHGFVESIEVSGFADIKQLYKRAIEADPDAELLLMPYIDATYSGIYVPESGALIIGQGNDGATAGRNSIILPVVRTKHDAFKASAAIESEKHLYAELVYHKGATTVVQARSGEQIPQGVQDYIPREMVVEHIIEPSDDLLIWEALCQSLAGMAGVVCQQIGGTVGCHAAIHSKLNGIAYVTFPVKIGDVLKPEPATIPPFDLVEFVKGVRLSEQGREISEELAVSIGILHNTTCLEYSPYYARLLGYALGWIYRASAIACLGEARHYPGRKTQSKRGRKAVYEAALEWDNSELSTRLANFSYKFLHQGWGSSFGGWKWFTALVQAVKLWNSISTLQTSKALGEANILINMAHNGGWLLDKFASQVLMGQAAIYPGEYMATQMPKLYEVVKANPEFKHIKPRNYRASRKWSLDVSATSKGAQLLVNKVPWRVMSYTHPQCLPVLNDLFTEV